MKNEEPTPTPGEPVPAWVGQLGARLGPNPTLAEVAVRIMVESLPEIKNVSMMEQLPRVCVDLAADILRECKDAEITDHEGNVLASLQVCDQGSYWATINPELADPTTLMARTRPTIEAKVKAHLEQYMKPQGPGPHLPGVIRGGEA